MNGTPSDRGSHQALPGKCRALAEPDQRPFSEPWEAKIFAIIVMLNQSGVFSWSEWVECFSREVAAAAQEEAAGHEPPTYYEQWLAAAEAMLISKSVARRPQLAARQFAIGAAGSGHPLRG